jgi:hypothetical protein
LRVHVYSKVNIAGRREGRGVHPGTRYTFDSFQKIWGSRRPPGHRSARVGSSNICFLPVRIAISKYQNSFRAMRRAWERLREAKVYSTRNSCHRLGGRAVVAWSYGSACNEFDHRHWRGWGDRNVARANHQSRSDSEPNHYNYAEPEHDHYAQPEPSRRARGGSRRASHDDEPDRHVTGDDDHRRYGDHHQHRLRPVQHKHYSRGRNNRCGNNSHYGSVRSSNRYACGRGDCRRPQHNSSGEYERDQPWRCRRRHHCGPALPAWQRHSRQRSDRCDDSHAYPYSAADVENALRPSETRRLSFVPVRRVLPSLVTAKFSCPIFDAGDLFCTCGC